MQQRNFNPVSIIRKKRNGEHLSEAEIDQFITTYTRDELPDYQMSAFLMAAFLQGLDEQESAYLTKVMLHSGKILDFSDLDVRKVDKHSTGGVGDKLSLILAPIVASCGVAVPMISGRGLGHTGGTLDKLESIPGFNVNIGLDRFREILSKHHLVMAGQTEEIAPADKRLYALRDVTGTVESIPLIASSIMSKKLAEGIDGLVLDVKVGSGAFMNTIEDAIRLAETLVAVGENFKTETIAYITDMSQPLGFKIGNWLEMEESVDALEGQGPEDVMEITYSLAGTMIYLGAQADSIEEGISRSRKAVEDGSAYEKWLELVEEQEGDSEVLKGGNGYPDAEYMFEYKARESGYIRKLNAYNVGMASLELGAGRKSKEESVDPIAGIELKKKIGDKLKEGETICVGYTNNNHAIDLAQEYLDKAIAIGSEQPDKVTLIKYKVDRYGVHKVNS